VPSDPSQPAQPDQVPVKVVDRRWWVQGEADATGDEAVLRKPTYVEQLEQQLAGKDEQLRDTIARYREAAAEFDAARVRARRDVAKEVDREKRVILAELLDVVDNLDRALEAARGTSDVGAIRQGVEMVRTLFLSRLEGFGVSRIAALGEPFDPACHDAVTTVPVSPPGEANRIVGVIREGYRIGNEVLRPAVVAVTVAPESGPPSDAAPGGDAPGGAAPDPASTARS